MKSKIKNVRLNKRRLSRRKIKRRHIISRKIRGGKRTRNTSRTRNLRKKKRFSKKQIPNNNRKRKLRRTRKKMIGGYPTIEECHQDAIKLNELLSTKSDNDLTNDEIGLIVNLKSKLDKCLELDSPKLIGWESLIQDASKIIQKYYSLIPSPMGNNTEPLLPKQPEQRVGQLINATEPLSKSNQLQSLFVYNKRPPIGESLASNLTPNIYKRQEYFDELKRKRVEELKREKFWREYNEKIIERQIQKGKDESQRKQVSNSFNTYFQEMRDRDKRLQTERNKTDAVIQNADDVIDSPSTDLRRTSIDNAVDVMEKEAVVVDTMEKETATHNRRFYGKYYLTVLQSQNIVKLLNDIILGFNNIYKPIEITELKFQTSPSINDLVNKNFNDIFKITPFTIKDNPIFQKPAINIMTDALMNHPIMPQVVIMANSNNANFNTPVSTAAGGFRYKKRNRTNTRSNRRYRKNKKTKKINKINKRKYKIKKNRRRFRKKY